MISELDVVFSQPHASVLLQDSLQNSADLILRHYIGEILRRGSSDIPSLLIIIATEHQRQFYADSINSFPDRNKLIRICFLGDQVVKGRTDVNIVPFNAEHSIGKLTSFNILQIVNDVIAGFSQSETLPVAVLFGSLSTLFIYNSMSDICDLVSNLQARCWFSCFSLHLDHMSAIQLSSASLQCKMSLIINMITPQQLDTMMMSVIQRKPSGKVSRTTISLAVLADLSLKRLVISGNTKSDTSLVTGTNLHFSSTQTTEQKLARDLSFPFLKGNELSVKSGDTQEFNFHNNLDPDDEDQNEADDDLSI